MVIVLARGFLLPNQEADLMETDSTSVGQAVQAHRGTISLRVNESITHWWKVTVNENRNFHNIPQSEEQIYEW